MAFTWLNRPRLLHLGFFVAAYILGCGFAQALAIVPGTGISIWPPSGLFIATLLLTPRQSWVWWILGGCLAEMLGNFLWFDSPWPASLLIYIGNALEAVIGAWLVNRTWKRPVRLETLQEVLAFVLVCAGIAPIVSATIGSATRAWFAIQSQSFATAWPLWWIGDATGVLIVAPLALIVIQNWRGGAQLSIGRWIEACVLGLIFLGAAALSLSGWLPFAYVIMPPLLWAAVRFELKGAAITLVLLAMITAVFTTSGVSQFAVGPESQRQKQIMLQVFLALSAFSALIVAAISRQHQLATLTFRQSMEALRDRERELSQLVDMVPSHLWRLTPEGEPIFFNKRMANFLGMDVTDLDGPGMSRMETFLRTVHPDEAVAFKNALDHCLATGESFSMRHRLRRADGGYHWMSSRADPMRDDDGRVIQWYGLSHDMDDQVKAEGALRQSERQLQQMIDAVPVRIWSTTPTGGPVYFNKRYQDHFRSVLTDYEDQEDTRIEKLLQELVHPDDAPGVQRTLWNCFENGAAAAMRFRWREKDDVYRWAECRVEPRRDENGSVVQWYGVSLDVDDEMRAQRALRERERELLQLVDMVPSLLWRLTPEGKPNFFNKRLINFLGMDIAGAQRLEASRLKATVEAIVHPDDAIPLMKALNHCIATGERFSMRYRLRRADGVYRWVDGVAEPMRDESGRIVQWYGLSHDIEDQVHAEEALRARERALRQLVETLPAMIDCATPEGEPVYRSRQLREFLGYDLEKLDGTGKSRLDGTLDAAIPPEELEGVKTQYAHCLATGEPYARRHRLRRADGEYRWVETRAAPMRNAEGVIVQWNVICLDIDSEIRVQEELRLAREGLARASQVASLAELSASIAHEVNQPLAATVANSHACYRWLTADPPNIERAKTTAERIIRDANSAADVVSRIRALFEQSMEVMTSHTTLGNAITEARDLVAEEVARRRVLMDINVESAVSPVALDRVQIQQVLVNLIRNGVEAMDSVVGDRVLRVCARRIGDVVQTEISDCGPGVEFPDRIFEPFFTTKQDGMGMGLAICRSIIQSHGGRLWLENNEPNGATFIFTLPFEAKVAS